MATLNFTIDEALNILWANGIGRESIKKIKIDPEGLLVTVTGGINIMVRQESFAQGVLKLAVASKSWAFKMADALGKVDKKLAEAIRDLPFIHREGKSLFIDLNDALQSKVKGIQIKNFELRNGLVKIEF
jgi:hypothetical protein